MCDVSFKGKKAIVIGGGSGIGASISEQLLSLGSDVAVTHIGTKTDEIGVLKFKVIAEKHNCHFIDECLDCTDDIKTLHFIDNVQKEFGRVDLFVYCAGFTSPVDFESLTADQWRKVVDINLNGAFIALHPVLPLMKKQRYGSVVLIGSAAITSGGGGRADYVSAKAGLEGLNLAVTKEFAPYGIRCNLVHPSLIETDLLKNRYPNKSKRQELAQKVPLKRLGMPMDVANLVCFLLSDKASYITGQSILVDGGRSYCS